MRLYHFTTAQYALCDIKNQRLKIARINDLNDPFELLAQDLSDANWQQSLLDLKARASAHLGFLCFSRAWCNPLMWSHYADRHKGVCMGFDVVDRWCQCVRYSNERPDTIRSCFANGMDPSHDQTIEWLQTKYEGWEYEDEVRTVCELDRAVADGEFYFTSFSPDLRLREVIMGVACSLSIEVIQEALNSYDDDIDLIHAKLADKTFEVVAVAKS